MKKLFAEVAAPVAEELTAGVSCLSGLMTEAGECWSIR
jgi:hypothetical protein